MSAPVLPFTTAGLRPELFSEVGTRSVSRAMLAIALGVLIAVGFGLRASGLSSEGLSEDELNKLNAVTDYRAHGLTSANGEHPLLMKAILTGSVVAAEKWNGTSLVSAHPEFNVTVESALRLPGALFGAETEEQCLPQKHLRKVMEASCRGAPDRNTTVHRATSRWPCEDKAVP